MPAHWATEIWIQGYSRKVAINHWVRPWLGWHSWYSGVSRAWHILTVPCIWALQ